MSEWISAAERLRAVRRAHKDYLFRAWIDRLIIGPMFLDRLAADLGARIGQNRRHNGSVQDMTLPADDD